MSYLQRKAIAAHGIHTWLRKQGFKTTVKTVSDITAEFLKSKSLPYSKFNRAYKGLNTADLCNAEHVQEYWNEFKQYVLINKEKYDRTSNIK